MLLVGDVCCCVMPCYCGLVAVVVAFVLFCCCVLLLCPCSLYLLLLSWLTLFVADLLLVFVVVATIC